MRVCVCVCPSLSVCLCLHVQAISLEMERRQMREERCRHARSGAQYLQLYKTLNVNLRWEVCESRGSAGAGGHGQAVAWPPSSLSAPQPGKRTSAFINNLDFVGFVRVWMWTFMCRGWVQSMCNTEQAEQDDLWHFLFHLSYPVQSVTVFFCVMGVGISGIASGEHVYLCVTVCVFVLHAWERKPVQGGGEGLGGLRQMGQRGGGWCSREQEREWRKEKIWNRLDRKKKGGRDNFMVVERRAFLSMWHRKNAACVCNSSTSSSSHRYPQTSEHPGKDGG